MSAKEMVKFFTENIDWDKSDRQKLHEANKGLKFLAIGGWIIAAIAIAAVIPLTTMHEFIPVVATVDRATGHTDVRVGSQRIDMDDPQNERMMIADLGRYVRARESFTRGEAESNYQTIYYMSADSLRGEWDAEYRADRNPNSWLATLSTKDQVKVLNMSVQFLPSDTQAMKVAQVRYDREKRIGAKAPSTQRLISTFTFNYDPANIPRTVEGIVVNPFGFTALNYRKDKESEERDIVSAQTAPSGVYTPGAQDAGRGR